MKNLLLVIGLLIVLLTPSTPVWAGPVLGIPTITSGVALPGTCDVGSLFFLTGVTAGVNIYGCAATNAWTLEGGIGNVSSVFTRTGPVTATSGDYTAAQVTNAVDKTSANTFTGGGLQNLAAVDFLSPTHASDPGTCTAGQFEYNSSSTVFKGCTSTNTWTSFASGITQLTGDLTAGPGSGSQPATLAATAVTPGSYTAANITVDAKGRITLASNGSAISGLPIQAGGSAIATATALNFNAGTGISWSCTNAAGTVSCAPSYNPALIATHTAIHAGEMYQVSISGTTAGASVSPNLAITAYTTGQCWDMVSSTADPVSWNIDAVGLLSLKGGDGSTALATGAIPANYPFTACYDGSVLRVKNIAKPPVLTVATLPTCNAGAKGLTEIVSDASSPTFLATLSGSSTTLTGALCNGTNWVAY